MFRGLTGALVGLALLPIADTSQAGLLTVFSDVDVFGDPLSADNDQMALNLLNGASSTMFSTQISGPGTANGLNDFYNSLLGINNLRVINELVPGLFSESDLLILDIRFNNVNPYSAAEHAVIAAHLRNGGNAALFAEGIDAAVIDSYNLLLSAVGSSIRYESIARCCGGNQAADVVLPAPLTAGVSTANIAAAHNLLGGTPAIQDEGFTIAAFERFGPLAVPEPSSLATFFFGLLGLVVVARAGQVRAGPRQSVFSAAGTSCQDRLQSVVSAFACLAMAGPSALFRPRAQTSSSEAWSSLRRPDLIPTDDWLSARSESERLDDASVPLVPVCEKSKRAIC